MNKENFSNKLNTIIKWNNLNGRSFTLGVALYQAIKENRLNDDEADEFGELVATYWPKLWEVCNEYDDLDTTNLIGFAEMLDLAALDGIARIMTDEDDEEEE